ncbi:Tetraspanin-6 [Cucurbita argyrosperma subsp. argyrosperma]|nr:Tetraspanin-6 [Cucurbita argyrosperma subsp. argyrosperma]
MNKLSNSVIGLLNFLTLLGSIPIIGGALWMARNSTTCEAFLQTPLLVLGFLVLLISLAGFVGACFNVSWALWLYLFAMLLLIATLLGFTLFGLVVASKGGGGGDGGEHRFGDYSVWLRNRVNNPQYWVTIKSCILGSNTCNQVSSWTPLNYLQRQITPIQAGCCKPPASCTENVQDPDCYRWNGAPNVLCYDCISCKAGVLETARRDWHKLSVLNIVMLIFLIAVYSIGCCAFRNTKRAQTDYAHGENRMIKIQPTWDHKMRRWLEDRKELY